MANTSVTMKSAKVIETSDENLEIFCDPCKTDSDYVIAVCYCEECKEYLCKTCNQVHRRLAATKEHVVKQINDLPKMITAEEVRTDLPEKCFFHTDQLVDSYCLFHEELCCADCLSRTHSNCETVKSIPEYIQTVDMAQELADLKSNMQGLADDVNETLYIVQTSLKAVELNHDEARKKMLDLKLSVSAHIEEIYSKVSTELNGIMEADVLELQPYKNKCEAIKFDLNAVELYMKDKIKNNKRQMFLAVKRAEVKVKSNRADLHEMRYRSHLNVTRYSFDPNYQMTELKTTPDSFGTFVKQDSGIRSAKLDKNLHVCELDEEESCCVTGLAVLSESALVVVDHNNKAVKLLDVDEDRILSKVTFESAPWDVTIVSDKLIAVTVPDKEIVNILSLTENGALQNLSEKQIIVNRKCYGISFANDKLFVTSREPQKIEVYDSNGKLVSSVDLDMSNPDYITVDPTRSSLYISDSTRGYHIKELDIDNLEEVDTLRSCRDEVFGMAIDKRGVLYYCDKYAHVVDTVCIEKAHGCDRQYKGLISELNNYPKCIAFYDRTNRLFVGMDGNKIDVYYVV